MSDTPDLDWRAEGPPEHTHGQWIAPKAIAAALRSNPGVWAVVRRWPAHEDTGSGVLRRRLKELGCEARSTTDQGVRSMWARWQE